MRALAIILALLTAAFFAVWMLGYFYISAMGCAWSVSSNCGLPWPWSLSGDDLQYMLLIPGAIFAALLGLTIWVWRVGSVKQGD